jgi:hypothetical protein
MNEISKCLKRIYQNMTFIDAIRKVSKDKLNSHGTYIRAEYTFKKNGLVDVVEYIDSNQTI